MQSLSCVCHIYNVYMQLLYPSAFTTTLHHSLLPFIIHYCPLSITTIPFIIHYYPSCPNFTLLFLNVQDELYELSPIPNTFEVSKKCTKMEPLTKTQTCMLLSFCGTHGLIWQPCVYMYNFIDHQLEFKMPCVSIIKD